MENQLYLISSEEVETLKEKINIIEELLREEGRNLVSQKNYTEKEVSSMIKVCRSTLIKLRKEKKIGFIKVGKTVLYPAKDLEEYLSRNHFKAEYATEALKVK